MGNCIDSERPATWVDEEDEWESKSPSWGHEIRQRGGGRISLLNREEEEEVEEEENRRKRSTATTKIKIKVSKKQLEGLLQQVNGERVAFQRMLEDLASESWREVRREQEDQAGHWRPELQSIPEAPE